MLHKRGKYGNLPALIWELGGPLGKLKYKGVGRVP